MALFRSARRNSNYLVRAILYPLERRVGSFKCFLENVCVTFIDKTNLQNPEKKENYWIHTLKTMVPWGLNILNSISEKLLMSNTF